MDKFLNYLLGTNDYALVGAGFVLSLFVALYPMVKDKTFNIRDIILKIISIVVVMRFYSFIAYLIGFNISFTDSMSVSFIAGLFSTYIIDKVIKNVKEDISEL